MNLRRMAASALVVGSCTAPASAATIGLLGGDVDPQLLTDPTFQLLDDCDPGLGLPFGYRCAEYDAPPSLESGISSIDFRLLNGEGAFIPFPDDLAVDPRSALTGLADSPLFSDRVTFRLFAEAAPLQCLLCVFFSSHDNGLADPAQVSVVGVNGVRNAGVTAIPEPAIALLAGPAALVAARRFRRTRRRAAVSWTRRSPPAP